MSSQTQRIAVSVLMPAYNHERFVAKAIESVWAQALPGVELVVVDDGSRDATGSIAASLAGRSPVPMTVIRRENRGLCRTLNEALARARGEWVTFLASDDFYLPGFLERSLAAARAAGDGPAAVHSDARLVDEEGVDLGVISRFAASPPLTGKDALRKVAVGTERVYASATLFVAADVLRAAGGFDETMTAEDFDLHLRLARKVEFVFVEEALYASRVMRGSLGRRPWAWAEDVFRALEKHGDLLGPELPEILQRRRIELSAKCFAHGGPGQGVRWAREALRREPGLAGLGTALVLGRNAVLGSARWLTLRLLPDPVARAARGAKHAALRLARR